MQLWVASMNNLPNLRCLWQTAYSVNNITRLTGLWQMLVEEWDHPSAVYDQGVDQHEEVPGCRFFHILPKSLSVQWINSFYRLQSSSPINNRRSCLASFILVQPTCSTTKRHFWCHLRGDKLSNSMRFIAKKHCYHKEFKETQTFRLFILRLVPPLLSSPVRLILWWYKLKLYRFGLQVLVLEIWRTTLMKLCSM